MEQGILGIVTGDGKGKTTSAVGLAIRSAGWGQKVLIIQFFKGRKTGEKNIIDGLDNISLKQFGSKKLINFNKPTKDNLKTAQEAWQFCLKSIEENSWDLLILDEINLAIHYQLLEKKGLIELIKNRGKLNLILTGRKPDQELIEMADFVSRVEEVKHHFKKGAKPRRGIEY
jgi:cob(I)alamin adenosyltransferase